MNTSRATLTLVLAAIFAAPPASAAGPRASARQVQARRLQQPQARQLSRPQPRRYQRPQARRLQQPQARRLQQPAARLRFRTALAPEARAVRHDARSQARIRSLKAEMESTVLDAATPPFEIVPEPQVRMRTLRHGSYQPSVIPQLEVSGVADGVLRGTVLAPVSGHVGVDSARRWATQDTFTISVQQGNGPRQTVAQNVKSTDMVTLADVHIPLARGQITRVFYDRSGSLGVGGFPNGRTIELVWNGN